MNMILFGRLRGACAAAATIACFAIPSAAFAHVFPQTQSPSAGAEVSPPANVTIVFNGPLEPAFSALTVSDAAGKPVNTAKAAVAPNDAKTISVPLPPLAPGKYTVHWVAVASDGHRTQGDYAFKVK
ncbi:copper resistance protein [Burkholderia sp. ABCPW 14]|uniref:copper resistance protein CopC n=1 Tax=Burkholderia sp. ABCPW 14 TaxID=1637860 RepID=UPI000770E278|nr:copper resistance protein CopC [Burkholderia sp. ABCPW 14]KVD78785.1 copper resistance protein [Burkholderia sp. ABCPW 14]